jgi:hypothetical protein
MRGRLACLSHLGWLPLHQPQSSHEATHDARHGAYSLEPAFAVCVSVCDDVCVSVCLCVCVYVCLWGAMLVCFRKNDVPSLGSPDPGTTSVVGYRKGDQRLQMDFGG